MDCIVSNRPTIAQNFIKNHKEGLEENELGKQIDVISKWKLVGLLQSESIQNCFLFSVMLTWKFVGN